MPFAVVALLFTFVTGCTLKVTINDRLSFATEQKIVQHYSKAPAILFVIDDATKGYELESYPSGFVGAAASKQFPIGWTLTAYLEQAGTAAFQRPGVTPTQIGVHLSSANISYTNSGFITGIDWVDLTLTLQTTIPREHQTRAINVRRTVDVPVSQTALQNSKYDVMAEVMELLVVDYIDEIVRLLANQ